MTTESADTIKTDHSSRETLNTTAYFFYETQLDIKSLLKLKTRSSILLLLMMQSNLCPEMKYPTTRRQPALQAPLAKRWGEAGWHYLNWGESPSHWLHGVNNTLIWGMGRWRRRGGRGKDPLCCSSLVPGQGKWVLWQLAMKHTDMQESWSPSPEYMMRLCMHRFRTYIWYVLCVCVSIVSCLLAETGWLFCRMLWLCQTQNTLAVGLTFWDC